MAKVVTDSKHYEDIANAIREVAQLPLQDKMKPSAMARQVREAGVWKYELGKSDGYNEGKAEGLEEGRESGYREGEQTGYANGFSAGKTSGVAEGKEQGEYAMWVAVTQNGAREIYNGAFMDWGMEVFDPPIPIVPKSSYVGALFAYSPSLRIVRGRNIDLSQRTTNSDTNQSYGNDRFFISCSKLEEVEDIKMPAGYYYRTFRGCVSLKTIAVLRFNSATMINDVFYNCYELLNLTIEGTIGQSGLDLQYSTKLSKASITSVMNALSASASGKSITLSKTAVNNAFTTAEWTALAGTKSNWTINLV